MNAPGAQEWNINIFGAVVNVFGKVHLKAPKIHSALRAHTHSNLAFAFQTILKLGNAVRYIHCIENRKNFLFYFLSVYFFLLPVTNNHHTMLYCVYMWIEYYVAPHHRCRYGTFFTRVYIQFMCTCGVCVWAI